MKRPVARVANSEGTSAKAISHPLTNPKTRVSASAARRETPKEYPSCTICRTRPGGTASAAISEMSIPRPITTIAIARPRMPSTATFCSNVSIFSGVAKPCKVIAKTANSAAKIANTIPCCPIRPSAIPIDFPLVPRNVTFVKLTCQPSSFERSGAASRYKPTRKPLKTRSKRTPRIVTPSPSMPISAGSSKSCKPSSGSTCPSGPDVRLCDDGVLAAVHPYRHAGDIARLARCEERHSIGDFLGSGHAADRDDLDSSPPRFRGVYAGEPSRRRQALRDPVGIRQSRIQADDADAATGVSRAEPRGDQHQSGVRRAAGEMGRRRHLSARANDVDDDAATTLRHAFDQGVDRVDVGEIFCVHRRSPDRGSELVGSRAPGGAGRIDQNIDRAEMALDRVDRYCGGRRVGHVRGDPEGPRKLRERLVDVVL